MMAVEHVLIGRDVIETVIMASGRRLSRTVDSERPVRDEQAGAQPFQPLHPIAAQGLVVIDAMDREHNVQSKTLALG
jgi:hypothetical protein